jgi:hypothetical protein
MRGESWAAQWRTLEASSPQPGVAHAAFQIKRGDGLEVKASAIAITSGRVVTVMLAAAPAAQFEAQLPLLAATLQSFRFQQGVAKGQAPAPKTQPQIQFVQWREPREGAYTLEVPAGWTVEGGVVRPDSTGTRSQVVMTAPGNRHIVWYGDWNLPRQFTQAGSTIRNLGDYATQGQGQGYVLANYQDAPTFAAGYLQQRFGQVQVTNVTQLPDLEQHYVQVSAFIGRPQERHSAAMVEFQLADGRQGAMSVVTSVTPNGFDDGALWTVQDISGFVSAPDELAIGALAYAHGRRTTHMDPRWFAGELGANQAAAAQLQQSRDEISAIQAGIVEQRWASNTQIADQGGQLLSGTTTLIDPQTGERFETQATNKYYFRDVTGEAQNGIPTRAGSDVDFNPSPGDFRRLLEVQAAGSPQ